MATSLERNTFSVVACLINKRLGRALLSSVFLWLAVQHSSAQQLEFAGDGRSLGITGESSDDVHIVGFLGSEDVALYGFTYMERADHPCLARAHGESLNDVSSDLVDEEDRCGSKGARDRSRLFAGWPDGETFEIGNDSPDSDGVFEVSSDRHFIHGISACRERGKLKGLIARSVRVLEDGNLDIDPTPTTRWLQPPGVLYGKITIRESDQTLVRSQNCNSKDWSNYVSCGPRQVAVAIGVHYKRNREPKDITGLELWCRRVVVRPSKRDLLGEADTDETGRD